MSFLDSLNISGSALTAGRLRMDVISENIANAQTTRTDSGDPYRRKLVTYECADTPESFRSMLEGKISGSGAGGVKVTGIVEDAAPFPEEYDPSSPDADDRGYVRRPNVDLLKETVDMMAASRAYDASLTAFENEKEMAQKAIEAGR